MVVKLAKFEKFLFYIFVFSIPFQLRKVLFSFTAGSQFLEWASGFLYFTDILIILILFLGFLRAGFKFKKTDIFLGLFFVISGISLIVAQNIKIGVYQLIKLAEFILLFWYVRNNLKFLKLKLIFKFIIVSGIFQAIIAILQFFKQSSLGLKHFEAGIFSSNIPGVATFFVDSYKVMRVYGTTPHPNVLAVFLFISIFCLYFLYIQPNSKKNTRIILMFCLAVLMLGLMLTFSRAVIITFFGSSLLLLGISFFRYNFDSKFRIIALFLLILVYAGTIAFILWPEISSRFLTTSYQEQAVTLRVYYNKIAVSEISKNPFLGLGMGNFVWYLFNNYQLNEFWLYQPVHNFYLLIATEVGLIGIVMFLIFIGKILIKEIRRFFTKKINLIGICLNAILFSFLFLGLIDHYFWTIQQSSLLLWLILAVINSNNREI